MSRTGHFLRIALALTVALPGCSSPPSHGSTEHYVRFVTPEDKAVLRGLADLKIEISVPEEATLFEVGVDGEPLTTFDEVTGNLRFNTTAISNGNKTLKVQLTGESGAQWSDTVNVQIKNAAHQLVSYRSNADAYAKGENVVLTLTYPVSGLSLDADFSELDDQFLKSSVTTKELGGGQYELRYALSPNDSVRAGRYEATIKATNSNQEIVTTPIDLMLRSAPRLPISIQGGTYVDEASVPFITADGAPSIQSVSGANSLITGTPNKVTIKWAASNSPADRLIFRSPDYSGYYVVPVDGSANQEATVSLGFAEAPQGSGPVNNALLNLLLSTVDSNGNTGNWTPFTLSTHHAQAAGTLVTLWWDNPADLDLRVTDPLGNTISYSRNQADGGKLEFDSNSMCLLDYRNTERISWPVGSELSGTYTVTANIYDACGQPGATYHLFISACGSTLETEGHFSATDVGTSSATTQLATFEVNCSAHAHGVVLFEQPKAIGDFQTVPAAFIPIRAITGANSTRKVMAESTTNADGSFAFYLPDSTLSDYVLEAEASWTPPGASAPIASVVGRSNSQIYRYTAVAIAQEQASAAGQTVSISVNDNAGAFNILDKMQRGFAWVSGHFAVADAAKVKPLRGRWTIDNDSPGHGSYYTNDSIYICGLRKARDEFDDSVIAHEFMHHATDYIISHDSPGGRHNYNQQVSPALAWNEGIASALGQQALGYPTYWNINDTLAAFVNLEYRAINSAIDNVSGADVGTSDGKMAGKVSEFLVAAVIWDLLDPIGDAADSQDQFDGTFSQSLGAMAHYLPPKTRPNRGASGLDLVDFLDGWRCGWPVISDQDTRLRLLLNERQFPYDYSLTVKCQ